MEETRSFYFLVPLLQLSGAVYKTMIWALRWSGTKSDQQNCLLQVLIEEYGFRFKKEIKGHLEVEFVASKETDSSIIDVLFWSWLRVENQCLDFTFKQKNSGFIRSFRWSIFVKDDHEEFRDWGINNSFLPSPTFLEGRQEFMTFFHTFFLESRLC